MVALATIPDVVRHAALTHGEGLATRCDGRSHTWRELALLVARLAGGLASAGVEAGVRVALLGQNTDHYLHLLFAVTAAGAIVVPLNVRSSPAELNFVLEDSDAAVVCAEAALVQPALPLPSCVHTLVVLPAESPSPLGHQMFNVLAYRHLAVAPPLPEHASCGGSEAFGLFFTSGTTGGPKGVVLSHANQLAQARSKLAAIPLHRASRYLCTLPLFHIGGMNITLAAAVAAAATNPNPNPNPSPNPDPNPNPNPSPNPNPNPNPNPDPDPDAALTLALTLSLTPTRWPPPRPCCRAPAPHGRTCGG